MQTAYVSYDDLAGLGLDLTGLIKTATDTYTTVKGAKDAKSIAVAQANAQRAQAEADKEAARARAILAGQPAYNPTGDIVKYGLLAAGLAVAAIAIKRRVGRRR